MKYFVGLDIGGTNIAAALVSSDGLILEEFLVSTEGEKGKAVVIKNIKKVISSIFSSDVAGIGVGCPGPLDPFKGIIKTPKNIPLENTKLKDILEEEFKVPVIVDNEANCFILGESIFGKAKDSEVVTGFTLGTGVGSGIVVNKKIVHGCGNAGEIGLTTIKFDGLKGKHNNTGEIEEYLAIRGIMKLAKGLKVKEPLDIYNLAVKGNKKAKKVFEEYGKILGVAITNLIYTFDPGAIILGGNISKSWKFFSKSMDKEIKARTAFNNAKIYRSTETERYTILGAVCPFLKK